MQPGASSPMPARTAPEKPLMCNTHMDPYDPSQVLFRLAKDFSLRAAERGAEYSHSGNVERRNREVDMCIGVIIMAHSALEAWINQVREQAGVPRQRNGSWDQRWRAALVAVAEVWDRESPAEPMPDAASEALIDLNALRNFPVHADSRARDRLESRFPSIDSFPDLLEATFVADLLERLDKACRYAERVVGKPAPRLEGAWPGWPTAT